MFGIKEGLRQIRIVAVCIVFCFLFSGGRLTAQTGGEGAIEGTVTDATGAAVAGATVTAKSVATGVETTRPTTSGGLYNISPLLPGIYTVTVTAPGFEKYVQSNMDIQALHVSGLNIKLQVGAQTDTVSVSDAPPSLETTNATLGGTIENTEYMSLPLLVSGNQQRDITQFSNLLPGAQLNPGGRSSIIGGTEQRLGELYLDGLPLTTISQQGDNRPVFNVIPLESIDQIQVVTSGFSAEYEGAGLENYALKSGTNKYHGTAADYIRNTIFDTWGFTAPWTTITNAAGVKGYQNQVGSKPVDHQNELSVSIGGPVSIPRLFDGKDKLFFEATYDKVHTRSAPTYGYDTLPTALMQAGDFTELLPASNQFHSGTANIGYTIFDPTTLTCPTPTTCTRSPVMGLKNGIPTPNVLPSNQISPISLAMQKFLPPLANGFLTNNYIGGIPSGYDNYLWLIRTDYDLSSKQRLSATFSSGRRHAVPYTSGTANLPVPYLASTLSTVVGTFMDLEDTYTITPHLVNQAKIGYMYFGGPPVRNITEGVSQYEATTLGITNLPSGQASDEFPGSSFAGSNQPTNWTQPSVTNKTVSHTFDIVDNVQWVLGKHAFNFGIQLQDLMENASTANGASTPITLQWSNDETAQVAGTTYTTGSTGFSYASYLLGAVYQTSTTLQPFSDIGSRYHTIAPYIQDDYKVTSKLTVNLGLRWDYLPGFRETADRWSFLNPTLTNPVTGTPGALQFAGNYGGAGVSCGCTTPVHTYWKNFGPRVGFSFSANDKTVFRGGFGILYSHGGGTGGAGATGTGQTGFTTPVTFTFNGAGPGANPVFYLNNSTGYQALGLSNTKFGGPSYVLPTPSAPSVASQALSVGNYVNGSGAFVSAGGAPAYADPYYGDRTPTFYFYNFGIQRSVTKDITLTANYVGSISHFIAGASGLRGLQSGEVNPIYLPLGSLLTSAATPANVAAAQAILPGCCGTPYAGFAAAAATTAGSGQATIAQSLKWMPQFSGTTDTWGLYSANAAYNALQISFALRPYHGLTLNVNYTYSKELDDAGTIRTGYAIPAAATLTNKPWAADRMDRSLSTIDSPENVAMFGTYKLPFGKGQIGGESRIVRAIAGGWEFSSIMTYVSGYPLSISSSACSKLPNQGTCMPDLNPNFTGTNIRQNGKWGNGITALTLGTTSYLNGYVSNTTPGLGAGGAACGTSGGPFCNANPYMIGDAPRTGAFNVRGPSSFRLASGLRRTIDLTEHAKMTLGVDCQNVTNAVTFGNNAGNVQIGTNVNTATFGTLGFASGDSRDFQFSGRISF